MSVSVNLYVCLRLSVCFSERVDSHQSTGVSCMSVRTQAHNGSVRRSYNSAALVIIASDTWCGLQIFGNFLRNLPNRQEMNYSAEIVGKAKIVLSCVCTEHTEAQALIDSDWLWTAHRPPSENKWDQRIHTGAQWYPMAEESPTSPLWCPACQPKKHVCVCVRALARLYIYMYIYILWII